MGTPKSIQNHTVPQVPACQKFHVICHLIDYRSKQKYRLQAALNSPFHYFTSFHGLGGQVLSRGHLIVVSPRLW
ncbi:hypothetical protein PHET_04177 [Paragonimus heterotremus]|uniref:Uncharacterized protein n=1 Tax=Paragonimus heterotremus TaxID=100268 RepID=A0A8J4TD22_9TREM|nr:hypothetical protein PHET_04177 [Paragonimus heterotremus]